MDQVNLLSMMFTAPAAAQSSAIKLDAMPGAPPLPFIYQLQQLLGLRLAGEAGTADGEWFAQLLGSQVDPDSAAALAVTADYSASGAGLQSAEAPAIEIGQLLQALLQSLRSILDAGDQQAQPATLPAGDTAQLRQSAAKSGPAQPLQVSPQVSALAGTAQAQPGKLTTAKNLMLRWPQFMEKISALLSAIHSEAVSTSSSTPELLLPETGQLATPWAKATGSAGGTAPALPLSFASGTPTGYAALASPTFDGATAAHAPASIRWFAGLQAPGVAVQPAPQATGSTAAAAPAAAGLTISLACQDGEQAVVTLTPLPAGPAALAVPASTLNPQRFTVQVDVSGAEPSRLTATLTVERVAVPSATLVSLPFAAALKPGSLMQVLAEQVAAEEFQPIVRATPTAESPEPRLASPLPQAVSTRAEDGPAVLAALPLAAQQAKPAGTRQQPVLKVALPAETSMAAVAISATETKDSASAQAGLKHLPLIAATPKAQDAAPTERQSSINQSVRQAAWNTPTATASLDLGLRQNSRISSPELEPLTQHLTLGPAAGLTAGDGLSGSLLPAAAQSAVPAHLLQFSSTGLETLQQTGLQYAEVVKRLMSEVSTARNAGNGLYNARLDLNPPNLGQMFVNISVRGDNVALQIAIASSVPKEQLKDSLNALRHSMSEAGLNVIEFKVVTLDPQQHGRNGQQQRERQQDADERPDVLKRTPALQSPPGKSTPFIGHTLKVAPALSWQP